MKVNVALTAEAAAMSKEQMKGSVIAKLQGARKRKQKTLTVGPEMQRILKSAAKKAGVTITGAKGEFSVSKLSDLNKIAGAITLKPSKRINTPPIDKKKPAKINPAKIKSGPSPAVRAKKADAMNKAEEKRAAKVSADLKKELARKLKAAFSDAMAQAKALDKAIKAQAKIHDAKKSTPEEKKAAAKLGKTLVLQFRKAMMLKEAVKKSQVSLAKRDKLSAKNAETIESRLETYAARTAAVSAKFKATIDGRKAQATKVVKQPTQKARVQKDDEIGGDSKKPKKAKPTSAGATLKSANSMMKKLASQFNRENTITGKARRTLTPEMKRLTSAKAKLDKIIKSAEKAVAKPPVKEAQQAALEKRIARWSSTVETVGTTLAKVKSTYGSRSKAIRAKVKAKAGATKHAAKKPKLISLPQMRDMSANISSVAYTEKQSVEALAKIKASPDFSVRGSRIKDVNGLRLADIKPAKTGKKLHIVPVTTQVWSKVHSPGQKELAAYYAELVKLYSILK